MDRKRKFADYNFALLVAFGLIIIAGSLAVSVDSNDLDEVCDQNNSVLYRINNTWQCGTKTNEATCPSGTALQSILENSSVCVSANALNFTDVTNTTISGNVIFNDSITVIGRSNLSGPNTTIGGNMTLVYGSRINIGNRSAWIGSDYNEVANRLGLNGGGQQIEIQNTNGASISLASGNTYTYDIFSTNSVRNLEYTNSLVNGTMNVKFKNNATIGQQMYTPRLYVNASNSTDANIVARIGGTAELYNVTIGNFTRLSGLTGADNDFLCITPEGIIYRSDTSCA